MNRILKVIKEPKKILFYLESKGFFNFLSDESYLKFFFKLNMGKKLNLKSPKTFNEKLQWLKLYDRKDIYTTMVDKYEAKKYVSEKIGEEYIIKTLGVWDSFDEINFDYLPNQFVLKCTHNSGGLVICKNKAELNIKTAKKIINKSLKKNYFYNGREWPYKNVKPRIIAEEYLEDESGGLVDYKFFCFNGYADCVMLCLDRHTGNTKFYFFDKEWNLLKLNYTGIQAPKDFTLPKPECIEKMFEISSKLSENLKFSRIDLYHCKDKIYFGEITFFPDSGFDANILPEADNYFGEKIEL